MLYSLKDAIKRATTSGELGRNVENALADDIAKTYGLFKAEAQNASNNGIDIFLVDDITNPNFALLIEVKATKKAIPRWTLSKAYDGKLQMTTNWLIGVNNWLTGDAQRILTGILKEEIKTLKLGIFVEADGTANFLKLVD